MNFDKVNIDKDAETTYKHPETYIWTSDKGYLGKKTNKRKNNGQNVPGEVEKLFESINIKEDIEFAK